MLARCKLVCLFPSQRNIGYIQGQDSELPESVELP